MNETAPMTPLRRLISLICAACLFVVGFVLLALRPFAGMFVIVVAGIWFWTDIKDRE